MNKKTVMALVGVSAIGGAVSAVVLLGDDEAAEDEALGAMGDFEEKWKLTEPSPQSAVDFAAPRESAKNTGPMFKLDVQQTLARSAKELHECYRDALEDGAEYKGKAKVQFTINQNGKVRYAKARKGIAKHKPVAKCISKTMKKVQFTPREEGGRIHVTFPLSVRAGVTATDS